MQFKQNYKHTCNQNDPRLFLRRFAITVVLGLLAGAQGAGLGDAGGGSR